MPVVPDNFPLTEELARADARPLAAALSLMQWDSGNVPETAAPSISPWYREPQAAPRRAAESHQSPVDTTTEPLMAVARRLMGIRRSVPAVPGSAA